MFEFVNKAECGSAAMDRTKLLFFHTELPSSGYASPGMVFIFELVAFQNKGSIKLGYNWPYWFSGREQQLCGGLHRARGPKVGNAT